MKNDKSKQEKKSPIHDGDTRPDKNIEKTSPGTRSGKKQKKFTKERSADINSIEDYKDAK